MTSPDAPLTGDPVGAWLDRTRQATEDVQATLTPDPTPPLTDDELAEAEAQGVAAVTDRRRLIATVRAHQAVSLELQCRAEMAEADNARLREENERLQDLVAKVKQDRREAATAADVGVGFWATRTTGAVE